MRELPPIPYIAIYRATMGPPDNPLVIDDGELRLTLTPGPISFSYSVPVKSFGPSSAGMTLGARQVNLPNGSYVITETLIRSPTDAERERVALVIAEAASVITLRYPHLLDQKLFEGVVNPPGGAVMWPEGPITLTASPSVNLEAVRTTIQEDLSSIRKLDADDRTRLQLAARWFRRGHETVNQVDKFLFWWTVLEIYPAKATTHVARETARLLKQTIYVNLGASYIKKKLELGPMHSMRGNIVHAGQAFVQESGRQLFDQRLKKLEATAAVCLRLLGGLLPGDDLDQFILGLVHS